MKKSTKNLLISSIAAVSGIGAFSIFAYSLSSKLVRIAIDREVPKSSPRSRFKISGVSNQDADGKTISQAAQKLRRTHHTKVEIKASDGETLVGHLVECESPKRILVAMHGWRSSWGNDFGMISDFWHNSGCTVLYAEQRGHNASGGKYLGFGMIERYDCLKWIKWVHKNISSTLPIYLAGISMGASTVLMTSSLDLPENVCGILADSGFTSPHDIWKYVTENNLHLSYKLVSSFADSMCRRKINMGSKAYSTTDALSQTEIPVLFIHGTHDKFVPISMTYENYLCCNSEKELLIVPGAGHGRSYLVDKERYEQAVLGFWNRFDKII